MVYVSRKAMLLSKPLDIIIAPFLNQEFAMKTIIRLFVLLALICGYMFAGCSGLETDQGTIAGTIFFNDDATRVGAGWVRVYDETGIIIIAEVAVDEQARYFVAVPEGNYIVLGCPIQDGEYTGNIEPIEIIAHDTTTYFFSIYVDPPEPQV